MHYTISTGIDNDKEVLLLFDATIFNGYRYIALYCRCLQIHSSLLPKNSERYIASKNEC